MERKKTRPQTSLLGIQQSTKLLGKGGRKDAKILRNNYTDHIYSNPKETLTARHQQSEKCHFRWLLTKQGHLDQSSFCLLKMLPFTSLAGVMLLRLRRCKSCLSHEKIVSDDISKEIPHTYWNHSTFFQAVSVIWYTVQHKKHFQNKKPWEGCYDQLKYRHQLILYWKLRK